MSFQRIAIFGDCHGCVRELKTLYGALESMSLDGIWSTGDLVDRGPSSGEVVTFCRTKGIKLVRGNHEDTLKNIMKCGGYTGNPDKQRTIADVFADPLNKDYLLNSPYLWAIDDLNVLITHAGLWPGFPLYQQAENPAVCRAQAINPHKLGESVWYEKAQKANDAEGFEKFIPWQRLYDRQENVVYGHSVYDRPCWSQMPHCGWTLGIDTGVPFGGALTAVILPDRVFVQVQAAKVYFGREGRNIQVPLYSGVGEDDKA